VWRSCLAPAGLGRSGGTAPPPPPREPRNDTLSEVLVDLPRRVPRLPRADPVFDWFARKAAQLLESPLALVSLVDVEGQVWPGAFGLPQPWADERGSPLSHSFCQYVVMTERPFVVPNAHDHPLVATNEAVADLGVVAYAGVPLTVDGATVGSLCAIDHRPRHWTQEQLATLRQLAAVCSDALTRRLRVQPA
jgi:GAF domain-containing protein